MTRYRILIYLGIFLTGATGLIFQVAWQRYFAFLLGNESRSVSLVIAFFLFGLATGYRSWGKFTARGRTRGQLLAIYGLIEAAIGIYALAFPYLFAIAQRGLRAMGPGWVWDAVASFALLFVPTFLMGATIPILTQVVPDQEEEVNRCHASVYGWNSLGAFAGALIGGFVLIPWLGIRGALACGAGVNLVVGIFYACNRIEGEAIRLQARGKSREGSEATLDLATIGALTVMSGAVLISVEVLAMRLIGLTSGSNVYVYPMGVSAAILGMALGSLSLNKSWKSSQGIRPLSRALILSLLALSALFLTAPFWPYWLSCIRVSLTTISTNFRVFQALTYVLVLAVLLPFFVTAGRILPLSYSLMNKEDGDYGRASGWLYHLNTVGTVLGALILGHFGLNVFSLEDLLKFDLLILGAVGTWALWRGESYKEAVIVGVLAAGVALLAPAWNRESHAQGLFRMRDARDFHFKGFFSVPQITRDVIYLRDDPNSTVAVSEAPAPDGTKAYSLMTNGKPDGNTFSGDYSTMLLMGVLPYLHAPDASNLKAAVIGLGTGITAGILGRSKDVSEVTVLELSSAVIGAEKYFEQANFELSKNPRVHIVQDDAFRYFARGGGEGGKTAKEGGLDILASEPSNPWVAGVDNLFTREFYELAAAALKPEGILVQWVQFYELSEPIVLSILENVKREFPYVKLYQVSQGDTAIMASRKPFDGAAFSRRFAENEVLRALKRVAIDAFDDIKFLELFDTEELSWLASRNTLGTHSLETPRLNEAARMLFLGTGVAVNRFFPGEVSRMVRYRQDREANFNRLLARNIGGKPSCVDRLLPPSVYCDRFDTFMSASAKLRGAGFAEATEGQILGAYRVLREEGLLAADAGLLARVERRLLAQGTSMGSFGKEAVVSYFEELARDGAWDRASASLERFKMAGTLKPETIASLARAIAVAQLSVDQFFSAYRLSK